MSKESSDQKPEQKPVNPLQQRIEALDARTAEEGVVTMQGAAKARALRKQMKGL